jgi:diadenosine tetraphosphate (Ap4A) HIT family hydrolase
MSTECIFCDHPRESEISVYANTIVIGFPRPVKAGHVAVAPIRHVTSFGGLEASEATELGRVCFEVGRAMEVSLGAEHVYVLRIGDRDPHIHFHLLPKFPGEPSLGTYVFGSSGWRAALAETNLDHHVELTTELRDRLTASDDS